MMFKETASNSASQKKVTIDILRSLSHQIFFAVFLLVLENVG